MVSVPPTSVKDQRRSPRIRHELVVELHEKQRTRRLFALDVARHGLYLATDDPPHERHLVQLTVHLPQGPIKAAASVMRTIKHDNLVDGVGVQFFALSGDAKQRWDEFIFALQRATPPRGVLHPGGGAAARGTAASITLPPIPPLPGTTLPGTPSLPPTAAEALRPGSGAERELGATFLVKLKTLDRLREFGQTHLAAGGTVLFTPVLRAEGELVTLVVVHPKTDEEFRLPGFVHRAHGDRPKRLDIHFHGVTPAVLQSFALYVDSGRPPAHQLEAPLALPTAGATARGDDELDLDVDVLDDEPLEADERLWREPGDVTGPNRPSSPQPLPPTVHPAADPGLKPATFLLRCDGEGTSCQAEPYAVDLGPCRGVLGLVADHTAFVSNKTGRVVTAPRFVSAAERSARARAFMDKGGKLDASVDLHTLLVIAALAEPVTDPDSGSPLKHTRAVDRLENAALRLAEGDPPVKTKVACPACKDGHLTVERVRM